MDAVTVKGLTKKYKDITAVDNISITVGQGEIFALLGTNGAGKTTTVKMLCCLTKPTSGEAFVGGLSVNSDGLGVKRIIGVSPQETAVAQNLSVRENLEFMCGIHGFSKEKNAVKTDELIEKFGLTQFSSKRASKLSGGIMRRLSIAMALISDPQILFLDEPTLGLDVISRSELWNTIRELKGKVTVILTTHYMEEAENLADRVAIMKNGKILTSGTTEEIKKSAGEEKFEQAFISIVKGDLQL